MCETRRDAARNFVNRITLGVGARERASAQGGENCFQFFFAITMVALKLRFGAVAPEKQSAIRATSNHHGGFESALRSGARRAIPSTRQ